jgi:hypothetical protein
MYKSHFTSWGISKNLTARNVPTMLHKLATTDNPKKDLVIQGQKVPQAKVERFLKRTLNDRAALSRVKKLAALERKSRLVARADPIPTLPTSIDLPDHLRLPEAVIHISHQFIAGGCEGIWAQNKTTRCVASPATIDWNCKTFAAVALTQRGEWEQAFDVLNNCFDQFKILLAAPTPGLFSDLYILLIGLPRDIATKLLEYAAQFSRIVLPGNHPLSLALTKLNQAGIDKVHEHAWVILSSHLRIGEEWFRDGEMEIFDPSETVASYMTNIGSDSVGATEAYLKHHIRRVDCAEVILRSELWITRLLYQSKNYNQVSKKLIDWVLYLITKPLWLTNERQLKRGAGRHSCICSLPTNRPGARCPVKRHPGSLCRASV